MPEPYYDDGLVTLYHGDCREIMPTLEPVDLVFTSPPYNLGVNPGGTFGHWEDGGIRGGNTKWAGVVEAGIDYDGHADSMPPEEYREWQQDVLRACWDRLTDRGAIYYNHKPRVQASTAWLPLELNPGLPLRQIITWARAGGTNFAPTHYVPTYEWIMVFAKPAFRLKDRGASGIGDVWRVPQDNGNPHPASFPIGLPGRAIETTRPATVLDPFCGSGTTLRAAKDAGVRAVGVEANERYCAMAARRLAQGSLFEDAA